jgi:hypothetical protein
MWRGMVRAAEFVLAIASIVLIALPSSPVAAQPPGPAMVLYAQPLAVAGQTFKVVYLSRTGQSPLPTGVVYVRNNAQTRFTQLALAPDKSSFWSSFALAAQVPASLVRGERLYLYGEFQTVSGKETVPPAGAAGPDVSYVMNAPREVSLGLHTFGDPTAPAATVARAGVDEVGFDESVSRVGLQVSTLPLTAWCGYWTK